MLVLRRQVGESIIIGGNIVVRLIAVGRNDAKFGIDAPEEIDIVREEIAVAARNQQNENKALTDPPLPRHD